MDINIRKTTKKDPTQLKAKSGKTGQPSGRSFPQEESIIIREETPDDIDAITCVTVAAFMHLAISNQTEHYIVHALRRTGALSLSLVAEMDNEVVGHAAFSPVTISDGSRGWFDLGPISVMPQHQKKGIGSALIYEGIRQLKQMGAKGCVLVGDPGYYKKQGFRNFPELIYEGVPPEVFLVQPFGDTVPRGLVSFHEGFEATE